MIKNLCHWIHLFQMGGPLYHWKAFRHQSMLWVHFRNELAKQLNLWSPAQKNLVLVGPSGGYCLPDQFLRRFRHIVAVDKDPLAPFFFRKNHPQSPTRWVSSDYFFQKDCTWWPDGPTKMLQEFQNHAFLFCNLLGQLMRYSKNEHFESWLATFKKEIRKTSFFSFHDVFSSNICPEWPGPIVIPSPKKRKSIEPIEQSDGFGGVPSVEELLLRFRAMGIQDDTFLKEKNTNNKSARTQKPIEWVDHMTVSIFQDMGRVWELWKLTDEQFHIVEMTYQKI